MIFAVLLLLSSSMVSPPLSDQPLGEISAFYSSNRAVVIVAQITGVIAAIAFALFVTMLSTVLDAPQVKWTGLVVAAAAAVTSVPLLALASLGANADPGIVRWTDLTDAVLFLAIAVFFGVLAGNGALPSWIRGLCVIGAGLTLVRGYL
ncbi:MAG TPA: hypothetical protein VLS86_08675, partial [Acidimicrobiia bacterium]|nr:hypothetical protein [Acidimicrobiia bacterium]